MNTIAKAQTTKPALADSLLNIGMGILPFMFLWQCFNFDRYDFSTLRYWIAVFILAIVNAIITIPIYLKLARFQSRKIKALIFITGYILVLALGVLIHKAHWYVTLPFDYFK